MVRGRGGETQGKHGATLPRARLSTLPSSDVQSSRASPREARHRQFKSGDKIRVNLHHGKIEGTVVRAVIQDADGIKLQVDIVGLDLTALIDTTQVVE